MATTINHRNDIQWTPDPHGSVPSCWWSSWTSRFPYSGPSQGKAAPSQHLWLRWCPKAVPEALFLWSVEDSAGHPWQVVLSWSLAILRYSTLRISWECNDMFFDNSSRSKSSLRKKGEGQQKPWRYHQPLSFGQDRAWARERNRKVSRQPCLILSQYRTP